MSIPDRTSFIMPWVWYFLSEQTQRALVDNITALRQNMPGTYQYVTVVLAGPYLLVFAQKPWYVDLADPHTILLAHPSLRPLRYIYGAFELVWTVVSNVLWNIVSPHFAD